MALEPPEQLKIADYFLDARVREDRGDRTAVTTDQGRWSYGELQALANQFGNLLRAAGVGPERRVIIALPDTPAGYPQKIGAVVVMVNPELKADRIECFLISTRAVGALISAVAAKTFRAGPRPAPAPMVVRRCKTRKWLPSGLARPPAGSRAGCQNPPGARVPHRVTSPG
jgi:acyl-coenzyme A synthetase/AMP-(fatty) acid ligase